VTGATAVANHSSSEVRRLALVGSSQLQVAAGEIELDGDTDKVTDMFSLLDTFERWFTSSPRTCPPRRSPGSPTEDAL
jgi:hypothetical protein